MFLPGVENNPEPGPYYESLQTRRASGRKAGICSRSDPGPPSTLQGSRKR